MTPEQQAVAEILAQELADRIVSTDSRHANRDALAERLVGYARDVIAAQPATLLTLPLDPPLFVNGEPAYNAAAMFSFIGNAIRLRGTAQVTSERP